MMHVQHAVTVLRPALFWMLLWAAIGATFSVIIGVVDPPSIDAGEGPLPVARLLGGVGAASGLIFGLLVLVAERHHAVADISLLRAMSWGALAGAALPLLTGINDAVVFNTCPLGAVSGVFYVATARLTRRSAVAAA